MFDFVRQHTRLALGFMLLLIIPSFVFFGVQGYQGATDGSNATVAKVDGQAITRGQWDDAHRRTLEMARRQAQGADPGTIDTPELRQATLDNLVRERALLAAANQLHLYPTPQRMSRLFDADPQFASLRGPDGRISREMLAMQGMTTQTFEQRLRQDFGMRQVLGGITQTVPAAATPTTASLDAFMERRVVQMQRFDPSTYRSKITPTDAEIEAYYKANEASFRAPEQASIEYVVLDLDALGQGDAITEAELREYYTKNISRYTVPEERRASHILIKADDTMSADDRAKAKARAEALLAEVRKNPASFADVARKNSQDGSAAQGGDLDFFGRDAMVKPFEEAAFALKVGEISPVVQSDFGYHIITVTGVRGGQSKPFEAARTELETELRKTRAQSRWADAAEQFTNTVYEQSDSLDPVVTKLKLKKQTALVQRTPAPGAPDVLASSKLLAAVFGSEALQNKRNTDAVEVGANRLVSARVLQHTPARTLALAEVKDRVRERVIDEQASALSRKDGQARLAQLQGGSTETLPMALTVSRMQGQGMPRELMDAALGADANKLPAVTGVDLGAQAGYVVLRVMQVLPRETPPGGEEPLRAQYAQAWAAAEADAYLAALKRRYKAEIKPAAQRAVADAASAPGR